MLRELADDNIMNRAFREVHVVSSSSQNVRNIVRKSKTSIDVTTAGKCVVLLLMERPDCEVGHDGR
jgi:hypothetical protein